MKRRYSILPPHIQSYYKDTRPKKIISDFIRQRFYEPLSFVKRIASVDDTFYFEYSARSWNQMEYHVRARKGLKNRTLLVVEARWKGHVFEQEIKNDPDFYFWLFFVLIRIPKSGLIETLRIGKETICEMCPFRSNVLSFVKSKPLPFDISKGLNPNRLLHFLNAKSKTTFLLQQQQ